jgi:hypothetical protein
MQLICISRGSYSCGKAFAESLARKLGCTCVGQEELLERATIAGIAAGKLEMACVNPRGLNVAPLKYVSQAGFNLTQPSSRRYVGTATAREITQNKMIMLVTSRIMTSFTTLVP